MYERILFPVDLHEDASWRKALPVVVALCRTFGAELHLLTVCPEVPVGILDGNILAEAERHLAESLVSGIERFAGEHVPPDLRASRHVASGRAFHEILKTARQIGADLIVMASHQPEMGDYLIGTNASRVVRHAEASVLVVR